MVTAPVGANVGLYVDLVREVMPLDVIQTQTGRLYLVLEVRRQTRGKHAGRQHLRAMVIDESTELAGVTLHRIRWYARRRRRQAV